jgi:hypothetical protein
LAEIRLGRLLLDLATWVYLSPTLSFAARAAMPVRDILGY